MVDRRRRVRAKSEKCDVILADAMCEKELEPVECMRSGLRRSYRALHIQSSYEDAPWYVSKISARSCWRARDVTTKRCGGRAGAGRAGCPPGISLALRLIDEDWLVLSTVHSAKGLEFDAVHVIHAADGNFPSGHVAGFAEGLEEERRLSSTSRSRGARRNLAVYVPLRYHHNEFVMITLGPAIALLK